MDPLERIANSLEKIVQLLENKKERQQRKPKNLTFFENEQERIDLCLDIMKEKGHEYKFLWGLMEDFVAHWTEKGDNDRLARWQKEKTFNPKHRFENWIINFFKWKK